MPQCILLPLTRLQKDWTSCLYISFRKKVNLSTLPWLLPNQSTNDWIFLSFRLTNLCLIIVPLLPICFWAETTSLSWKVKISKVGLILLRQRIRQLFGYFLQIPAQFHDRLRESPCLLSGLVLVLRTMVVRPPIFSQLSLIFLKICDLTSWSLVIHFVKLNPPLLRIFWIFW